MRTLICGSLAYDTIMVFEGRFKDQILPDQVHILNVSFLVPALRREFGGTAGNIAYNLHLLGGKPVVMACVGEDAGPYVERLHKLGFEIGHVKTAPGAFTAQAFITTDLDDNQITAFHPGAMSGSPVNHVGDAKDIGLAIIAPDSRDGMVQHARELADANIPFVFDPGQGLPMFSGTELMEFIDLAAYVTVNDYEAKMLADRTGRTFDELAKSVEALVVTQGGLGSTIYAKGRVHIIPSVRPERIADPTGCGDAYRGGLLYGLANGMDWETTGRLASTMGALKIAHQGPQNHAPSRDHIAEIFASVFGYTPW
ncbi:MAG: carbohydrate kinase family protein [Burkholderiaceae bacterium]